MRKTRLAAFLLAVILCVACAAPALAKSKPLTLKQSDAMEKRICALLREQGFNVDETKNVKRVDIDYTSDGYTFTLQTLEGDWYRAKFRGTQTITFLMAKKDYEGTPMEKPKLDKATMKRVEKKVDKFLKKTNPSLRKKIGKLKVISCVVNGKRSYVEIRDSKKKVRFTLKISPPAVKVWSYSQIGK